MTEILHEHGAPNPLPTTELHLDDVGMPCFQCYFRALYEAAPEDMLAILAARPRELPPEQSEHADRISVVFGYLCDAIGDALVELYDDPEPILTSIVQMMRQAVAQYQVEREQGPA